MSIRDKINNFSVYFGLINREKYCIQMIRNYQIYDKYRTDKQDNFCYSLRTVRKDRPLKFFKTKLVLIYP